MNISDKNDPEYIYVCTKCGIGKPNKEYSADRSKKNRKYVSQCKSCRSDYVKLEYNQDTRKRVTKEQRLKHRIPQIFSSSKGNAKRRNIEHSISIEYVKYLFEKQNGLCFYTNKRMFIDLRTEENNDDSISIDRVDPSKGYIEGNVVLCRWIVNRIKNDLSLSKLIEVIDEIKEQQKCLQ